MNLFVQLEFICLLHFPHSEHPCCHGTEGYHKIHFTIPNSNLSVIQFPIIFHSTERRHLPVTNPDRLQFQATDRHCRHGRGEEEDH